jgi:hypothetical protein
MTRDFQCSSAVPSNQHTAFTFNFSSVSPISSNRLRIPTATGQQTYYDYSDNTVFQSTVSNTCTAAERSVHLRGSTGSRVIIMLLVSFSVMSACIITITGIVTGFVVVTLDEFELKMMLWFLSLTLFSSMLVFVWSICGLVTWDKYQTLEGSNIVFFPYDEKSVTGYQ